MTEAWMPESFFSYRQVYAAATEDELRRGHGFPHVHIAAKDVIGRMTGLDMEKYELVPYTNLHGWELKRRDG